MSLFPECLLVMLDHLYNHQPIINHIYQYYHTMHSYPPLPNHLSTPSSSSHPTQPSFISPSITLIGTVFTSLILCNASPSCTAVISPTFAQCPQVLACKSNGEDLRWQESRQDWVVVVERQWYIRCERLAQCGGIGKGGNGGGGPSP
jgi:hypothetical protein